MFDPLYYTARQAAALLDVSAQTIKAMCRRGDFPGAVRIGTGRMAPWRIPAHLPLFHPERAPKREHTAAEIFDLINQDLIEFRRTGIPVAERRNHA